MNTKGTDVSIIWFEQDLRLYNNAALEAALAHNNILAIYIRDEDMKSKQAMAASDWWLHQSLMALDQSLENKLNIYQGDAAVIIECLCRRFKVTSVYWSRRYEPLQVARDKLIKQSLRAKGILVQSFNSMLLHEPWQVLKKDGAPYKVFTPYYNRAKEVRSDGLALVKTQDLHSLLQDPQASPVTALSLLSSNSWGEKIAKHWQPGVLGAGHALDKFIENGLDQYNRGRDHPAKEAQSTLSPHLHFGELSPHQLLARLSLEPASDNKECYIRQLYWREFSYYLQYYWPKLSEENLRLKFDYFPWQNNMTHLLSWQQGLTGYPLVDAGMRELWQTGYIHNRVRMVVASFLVKNLLIDWRLGAKWFLDCLVDADLASNSASWQWVAGSGTDAAPYFRIFNPTSQGEKFDRAGDYTKKYLPELGKLPTKYVFTPWAAPSEVLAKAGIILGTTYPLPIVDLKASRIRALEQYKLASSEMDNRVSEERFPI